MQNYLDDLLFWLGAALVTTGAGLIYVPAALIVSGAFCVAGGILYGLGASNAASVEAES
jgi:hypothetical protein